VSLLFTYSYFVNATVLSVVGRKNAETEISLVSSQVSGMEAQYLSHVNELTLDLAYSRGFKEKKNVVFAQRKSLARDILTLNSF